MIIIKIRSRVDNIPIQFKSAVLGIICLGLQKGSQYLTTPIFTRLMTPSEYGNYNVYSSILSIVAILITLNISFGVYNQGIVKFEDDRKRFSSSLQGLTLTLMVLWTALYFISKDFWNNLLGLTTVQMFSMLIQIWATAVFNFWATEQKMLYKYNMLVVITLIFAVANPMLCVVLIKHSEDKVTAKILGSALISLITYIPLFFIQTKNGKTFFCKKYWCYALLFNLPLVPHYLSQVVLNTSDRIMIERMIGDSQAGIYSLAYTLSLAMQVITTSLNQVLSPWFFKKIKEREYKDIGQIVYACLGGTAILIFVLITLGPEIVRIFAPMEYYESIWIIPPVAISVFFSFSYDMFSKFSFYYEKRVFIATASIIGAVLNVILNYICINRFGYIAAGYTTLFCYIVYSLCHYFFMNRVCDKYCGGYRPFNGKIIALISSALTIFGLLMLLTYNYLVIRYSVISITLIICAFMRKKIIKTCKKIIELKKEV